MRTGVCRLVGMNDFSDLSRRIESLIRPGAIAEVDLARARVRVNSGGLTTDWLPWFAIRAGDTRDWNPPTVGEQCVVLAPSGDPATGFVLTGLFSGAHPAPSHSGDERLVEYPDGARITYNHATGALSASGVRTVFVEAADHVTIDCPDTACTGDMLIKGNLLVEGIITASGWRMGSNGGGGGEMVLIGNITHRGRFTNTGSLSSNGVELSSHSHGGNGS